MTPTEIYRERLKRVTKYTNAPTDIDKREIVERICREQNIPIRKSRSKSYGEGRYNYLPETTHRPGPPRIFTVENSPNPFGRGFDTERFAPSSVRDKLADIVHAFRGEFHKTDALYDRLETYLSNIMERVSAFRITGPFLHDYDPHDWTFAQRCELELRELFGDGHDDQIKQLVISYIQSVEDKLGLPPAGAWINGSYEEKQWLEHADRVIAQAVPFTTALKQLVEATKNQAKEEERKRDKANQVPYETRFAHRMILGSPGSGKTQMMSKLIWNDIVDKRQPTVVVVDSHTDLIHQLSRLQAVQDRLVLISPQHTNPAINIFDVKRLKQYDQQGREQVLAGAIQTLDYFFSGIADLELTGKQGVAFRYMCRLMLALPETMGRNATMLDMLRLLDSTGPYQEAINTLSPVQQEFFNRDFDGKEFKGTKEQIRYRINAILENPAIERLFTSQTTKLDLFDELQNGKIILIDTSKSFLKDASPNYGRVFIALILQAVMERAALHPKARHPVFMYVDEAHQYFDKNVDELLTEVRKYKLGCIFAFQRLSQASQQLRDALMSVDTKMVSSVTWGDARALAPNMNCEAEEIMEADKLRFIASIKGMGIKRMTVDVGFLDRQAKVSKEEFDRFLAANRKRLAEAPTPTPTPKVAIDPTQMD